MSQELLKFPEDDIIEDSSISIGQYLKEARSVRKLSLEDASAVTRISKHYLQALEDEDFDTLPAPVYARGFMRSYAKFLGLDPVAAVMAMPSEMPQPSGLEPLAGLRQQVKVNKNDFNFRVIAIFLSVAVVAILLLWLAPKIGSGTGIDDLDTTQKLEVTIVRNQFFQDSI
ncbi:MAG: hypothetical protein CL792_04620 [Chloroflexi bacterium]|nr:hypothetical protein [Chloroflexota bacterium]|tara:strand:- start:4550 stop:5062 length:513 start_codon:yes stop_codon:yes gene_type:complete